VPGHVASGTEFKAVILEPGGGLRWEPMEGNRQWPRDVAAEDTVRFYYGEPAEYVEELLAGTSQTSIIDAASGARSPEARGAAGAAACDGETPKTTTSVGSSKGGSPQGVPRMSSASRLRDRLLAAATQGELQDYYVLEPRPIGEGAFGVVCKAHSKTGAEADSGAAGAVCAVKTVVKKDIKDLEAFIGEIELSRSMDHPNLIRLYNSFETKECIYLVQELCEGGELFDRIVEVGHFTERDAAIVMRQMFTAVGYLHTILICHRDVKPENFLFQTKEPVDRTTLKMIDFGLSKRFEPGVPMQSNVGTIFYVAPEVLSGGYGHACDVWSCGTLLYCLLAGRPPFGGRTDREILSNVQSARFQLDGPTWTPISTAAKDLIRNLLTLEPEARPVATQVLHHAWLNAAHECHGSDEHLSNDMLKNLKSWRTHDRFERAAIVAIAGQMGDNEIKALKDVFLAMDADNDGHLSLAEMRDGIRNSNLEVPAALKEIMEDVDSAEHQGTISYTDFLAATLDRRAFARRDLCWHAFRNFDTDQDGTLSVEEVSRILQCDLLQTLPEIELARKSLAEADANHDGQLSFDEFMAFVLNCSVD